MRRWATERRVLPGLLLVGTALVPPALAAEVELDPITVVATRTERALDDQPFSVDVVGPAELERLQPGNLGDTLRAVPGVSVEGGSRRSAQTPNIRGFGGQRVVTTIDGVRQNFDAGHKGGVFLETDLLQRIEILKGSGSALYGSGAIGGVLALTTKNAEDYLDPGESFGARIKLGYSTAFDEPLSTLTVYGRGEDWIDAVASGTWRNGDDYRAGADATPGTIPFSAERQVSGLFKTNLHFTPHHTVSLMAQVQDLEGAAPINTSTLSTSRTALADRLVERRSLSASYAFDDPGVPLVNPTVTVYHNLVTVDEVRLSDGRNDVTELTTSGIDARNTARFTTGDWFAHAVTLGTEWFTDEQEGLRNGVARGEYPNATANTVGVYLQDELAIGEYVTLVPGLRFDSYHRTASGSDDLSESHVSPRIGATVKPIEWLSLYGSYGEAFRAPTMTELYVTGTHFGSNIFVPNPDLKPETARTWEGGVRLAFDNLLSDGDGLRMQAGYFHTKAEDFISQTVNLVILPRGVLGGTTTSTNIGQATISGFESELRYDAARWFAEVGASRIRGDDDDTGEPIDSIPADKVVATLGVKLTEWDLVTGVTGSFVADQDRVSSSGIRTPGYGIADLFAVWAPDEGMLKGVEVSAAVHNVTDRDYRDHLAVLSEPGRDFRVAVAYSVAF